MIKIEWSKALGRKIRQEEPAEQSIPTWAFLKEAIQGGRAQEALEFMEHCREQDLANNNNLIEFVNSLLSLMAETYGEESLEKVLRSRGQGKVRGLISDNPGVLESLQRGNEAQR